MNKQRGVWNTLHSKKIVVAGLGVTGRSVAGFARNQGAQVVGWDTRDRSENKPDIDSFWEDYTCIFGNQSAAFWSSIDGIVISPGIKPDDLRQQCLRGVDCPIIGDVELFAYALAHKAGQRPKLVGITGSNGKTTTTLLVEHVLNNAGVSARAIGNVGVPVLDVLDQHFDVLVLELSSFQLETVSTLQLDVAAILNVSSDHLDRHGDFRSYVAAKQNIYANAKNAVFWSGQIETRPVAPVSNAVSFGEDCSAQWRSDGQWISNSSGKVFPVSASALSGSHNALNIAATCAIVDTLGISVPQFEQAFASFDVPPHRCVEISTCQGIHWIDDSKATNPGATIAALQGIGRQCEGRLFVIAGGDAKGAALGVLADHMQQYVEYLFAIGKDGKQLLTTHPRSCFCNSLEEAVTRAADMATSGDTVLLSPACASLDMFSNYRERAAVFAAAIGSLAA